MIKNKYNFVENIIIPMAGHGSRFKDNNFNTIKPLIQVDHECILEKSMSHLPNSKNKIIILKKDLFNKYSNLRSLIFKKKFNELLLKNNTLGQADTCYKSKDIINLEEDVLIHSCDYILRYSKNEFFELKKKYDVIIFTFKLRSKIIKNYSDFAYCLIKNNKTVGNIIEKKTISNDPTKDQMAVGTFWFKKAENFFKSCEQAKKQKNFIKKELYIANNINNLIKNKLKVGYLEVDFWNNLGDVYNFYTYIYWKSFFSEAGYINT